MAVLRTLYPNVPMIPITVLIFLLFTYNPTVTVSSRDLEDETAERLETNKTGAWSQ